MTRGRFHLFGCLLLISFSLHGCGYHLSLNSACLSGGGRKLCVPVAQNETTETWTTAFLTRSLREQAGRVGLEIVSCKAPVLSARVVSIRSAPRGISRGGGRYTATEREVSVLIRLGLTGQESLVLSDRQSYLSAPDVRGTEANRQLAVRIVIDRLAVTAIDRISRKF
jgi:hypothetical protein